MPDLEKMRSNMVFSQLLPNKITNPRLIKAFTELPREYFVAEKDQTLAYSEHLLEVAPHRFLLQPLVLAKLLQAGNLAPNNRVLDVGTATGYGAALLSYLVRSVVAVEEDPALFELMQKNLETVDSYSVVPVQRELTVGVQEDGPYDVIFIEGAVEDIPPTLFEQLKEKGRLLTLEAKAVSGLAQAVQYQKTGTDIAKYPLFECEAALLPPFRSIKPEFQF